MKDSGTLIAVILVALTFGTFWLLLYTYGLYQLGRRMAKTSAFASHPYRTAIQIGLAGALVASAALFFEMDPIPRFATMAGLWLLHAQPIGIGYWAGLEIKQKREHTVFNQRVAEWLKEWEEDEPPPIWLRDSLQ